MTADVLVVGAGLIGTSIALALKDLRDVVLTDTSQRHLAAAVGRRAGRVWDSEELARLVVVAVPPSQIATVIATYSRVMPEATFTQVSSVQAKVELDVEAHRGSFAYCGSHPLAGREVAGPLAAASDLFDGRPWVVCPAPFTTAAAQEAVTQLVRDCGGDPVVMGAAEHDAAMALVSHLPQVAASAVAARLLAPGGATAAGLSGPGLRDTTRIAGSDPRLWVDVLSSNATLLAPLVHDLAADLSGLAEALERVARGPDAAGSSPAASEAAQQVLLDLLQRGNQGRALVPVKRGEHDQDFVPIAVSVLDRPGELARLLTAAGEAGLNVEDVRVEHLRGRPRGVIELYVAAEGAEEAAAALTRAGWDVLER